MVQGGENERERDGSVAAQGFETLLKDFPNFQML